MVSAGDARAASLPSLRPKQPPGASLTEGDGLEHASGGQQYHNLQQRAGAPPALSLPHPPLPSHASSPPLVPPTPSPTDADVPAASYARAAPQAGSGSEVKKKILSGGG